MKKTTVVICTILVCLISIWLWFYFWRFSNNTSNDVVDSNFDKQSKCSALYDQYKDKTKSYGDIDELSVFYSPKEDSCLASYIVMLDSNNDGISDVYRFFIVDALKWDSVISQCSRPVLNQDDECSLPTFKKLKYELAN